MSAESASHSLCMAMALNLSMTASYHLKYSVPDFGIPRSIHIPEKKIKAEDYSTIGYS